MIKKNMLNKSEIGLIISYCILSRKYKLSFNLKKEIEDLKVRLENKANFLTNTDIKTINALITFINRMELKSKIEIETIKKNKEVKIRIKRKNRLKWINYHQLRLACILLFILFGV